ncbi:MAG: GatB/YqeY domain-containing protein [bacterium]|nr:GatB/YqeY domain-containing protein [bacterium]
MSLHQDIREQMTEAMKARDTVRLDVLRGLLASFVNELISKGRRSDEPARTTDGVQSGGELSDEEALSVIARAVKQRKDSIEQFEKGGRADLAGVEKSELVILETYLPAQMSRDEVLFYVKQKISGQSSALTKVDSGKFMGIIMKELKGKADGTLVKEIIDTLVVS